MTDKAIEELEQFLLPFALKRFDFDSYKSNFPMGRMARNMAKSMMGDWINNMVTWQVRAYIRCLYNVESIELKNLAAVVNAEASYMSGVGPMGLFQGGYGAQSSSGSRSSSETMMEAEIHVWMIYLEENDKLPGNYERFTGKYTS